jgi:hypothetical protein
MEAQKTPVAKGVRSAFETSPLKRAAALIAAGNKRNAEKEREQMSKRAEPKAGFTRMSKAAALLNAAGGYRLPLNGLEIADFSRARIEGTTAPATTAKPATAAAKAKKPLTLADRIKALSPAARAEMKQRLDAFNASRKVNATTTKSKPTVEATVKPKVEATAKPAAPAPVSTIKVSKGSRWSVAMGVLNRIKARA